MSKDRITRRDFLKAAAMTPVAGAIGGLAGTMSAALGPHAAGANAGATAPRPRVVLVRDSKAVLELRQFDADVVQTMLDDAVTALFGVKDPVAAWKRIVGPADTVGIKTNAWTPLPTGKEVEEAIKRRVLEAGVSADKLAVADRGVLENPVFQNATVLINARPARVHYWAGMGSCIKNYILFVPNPSKYHGDACADLAKIWSLPPVQGRTKLNILVMLTPQYHNIGPRGFSEKYLWPYGGLIVGQDVVAVDSTGYRVIQAKRREVFGEDRALETSAHHIALADTRHNLGRSDPKDIELIKLGWTEGLLI